MSFAALRDRAVTPAPRQGGCATLLTDSTNLVHGPPGLCDMLTPAQRDCLLAHGRRQTHARGATAFTQGAIHDAIYLIEIGRLRVYALFHTSDLKAANALLYAPVTARVTRLDTTQARDCTRIPSSWPTAACWIASWCTAPIVSVSRLHRASFLPAYPAALAA